MRRARDATCTWWSWAPARRLARLHEGARDATHLYDELPDGQDPLARLHEEGARCDLMAVISSKTTICPGKAAVCGGPLYPGGGECWPG